MVRIFVIRDHFIKEKSYKGIFFVKLSFEKSLSIFVKKEFLNAASLPDLFNTERHFSQI